MTICLKLFLCFSQDQAAKDKVLQSLAGMSSAQIVSATLLNNKGFPGAMGGLPPFGNAVGPSYPAATPAVGNSVLFVPCLLILLQSTDLQAVV